MNWCFIQLNTVQMALRNSIIVMWQIAYKYGFTTNLINYIKILFWTVTTKCQNTELRKYYFNYKQNIAA